MTKRACLRLVSVLLVLLTASVYLYLFPTRLGLVDLVETAPGVHEFTLDNGLHVILQPVDTAPVVAMNVWVHVGSKDEDDGTRGLAHIQEHMLFQGTEEHPPGSIFKSVEAVGGRLNAYTTLDRTVYHIVMPKQAMAKGLNILSSMMSEALINQVDLNKELEVVMEEFRRSRDDPNTALREAMQKIVYTKHPYRHPVIGYQEQIEGMQRQPVMDFYERFYVPANMTVVLVGDFNKQVAAKVVRSAFNSLPQGENPKRDIPAEPEQTEAKAVVLYKPVESASLALAYPITSFANPDTPALDILFTILGTGDTARLARRLREDLQLVTSISAHSYTSEQAGWGLVSAELEPKNIEPALEAILNELTRVKTESVSLSELDKAKLRLESSFIYDQESYNGLAGNLGLFHVISGGTNKIAEYRARLAAVTQTDIQAMAEKYLVPDRLTLGLLYPEEFTGGLTETELLKQAAEFEPTLDELIEEDEFDSELLAIRTTGEGTYQIAERIDDAAANVTKVVFENGVTLLIREDHSVETVAYQTAMFGGQRYETKATNGINNLTKRMFDRGTVHRSFEQIAQTLDHTASSLAGYSGNNVIGVSGRGLSKYSEVLLDLLIDMSRYLDYPPDQFKTIKRVAVESVKQEDDYPSSVAMKLFRKTLFGEHPFALPWNGTVQSLTKLTNNDVIAFAKRVSHPQNLLVAVVGDVDIEATIDQIGQGLGTWQADSEFSDVELTDAQFPTEVVEEFAKVDKKQANILLGFKGIPFGHTDRYALEVVHKILSGAGGRLFRELRDKQSLAYSVTGTNMVGYNTPGFYAIYIGADPTKQDQAVAGIIKELTFLQEELVSEEELSQAKEYLIGSHALSLQSYSAQLGQMIYSERYGFGYDDYLKYIEAIKAVTAADVQHFAKEYFTLDRYVLSIAGPE